MRRNRFFCGLTDLIAHRVDLMHIATGGPKAPPNGYIDFKLELYDELSRDPGFSKLMRRCSELPLGVATPNVLPPQFPDEYLNQDRLFVTARKDGVIIGSVGANPWTPRLDPLQKIAGDAYRLPEDGVHLSRLGVDSAYREHGISKILRALGILYCISKGATVFSGTVLPIRRWTRELKGFGFQIPDNTTRVEWYPGLFSNSYVIELDMSGDMTEKCQKIRDIYRLAQARLLKEAGYGTRLSPDLTKVFEAFKATEEMRIMLVRTRLSAPSVRRKVYA